MQDQIKVDSLGFDTVHSPLPHVSEHHDVAVTVHVLDFSFFLRHHVVRISVHVSVRLCEDRSGQISKSWIIT